MSRDGWEALPRGDTGLSAVCVCGISWSYSLTIFGSRQFQALRIGKSGCWTTNVKLAKSADPCERRPTVASHRSLSCLLTVKLFISRSTTRVNNNSPVHYDRKCKDDRMFISHRRFSNSRSFCWEGRGKIDIWWHDSTSNRIDPDQIRPKRSHIWVYTTRKWMQRY